MRQPDQLAAYRSYDGPFGYTDALDRHGRCYLQVFELCGSLPLVIACEVPDNPGSSITNAAEELATQVWQQVLPHAREGFRFIEAFIDPHRFDLAPAERFAEVTFRLDGNRLHFPQWEPISRAAIEALIGGPFTIPVESSY